MDYEIDLLVSIVYHGIGNIEYKTLQQLIKRIL